MRGSPRKSPKIDYERLYREADAEVRKLRLENEQIRQEYARLKEENERWKEMAAKATINAGESLRVIAELQERMRWGSDRYHRLKGELEGCLLPGQLEAAHVLHCDTEIYAVELLKIYQNEKYPPMSSIDSAARL